MKKSFSLFSRGLFAVLAAGAVCVPGKASAQEARPSGTPQQESLSALQPAGQKPRKSQTNGATSPAATSSASPTGGNSGRASGPMAGGTLDRKDRDFMMTAAKGGMMEVHMGEMAQKMGQSADVKKIGARMVADHTKVNGQLMALASSKGVKLDTRHKMDKMDSANFDQMYLDQMVKDHNKDIADFQTEAKNGMDPELKSFAAKNLPTLQSHLKMVKDAQAKMMKKS